MPKYRVTVWLSPWTVEVEADDDEAAVAEAQTALALTAAARLDGGTWEAVYVDD